MSDIILEVAPSILEVAPSIFEVASRYSSREIWCRGSKITYTHILEGGNKLTEKAKKVIA